MNIENNLIKFAETLNAMGQLQKGAPTLLLYVV